MTSINEKHCNLWTVLQDVCAIDGVCSSKNVSISLDGLFFVQVSIYQTTDVKKNSVYF